ncbi:MAG: hypothetical protein EP298_08655 [Gammaproteobacteria bacterium]|nr:MAG: hypothetical protein EP298_08655 [Gammaproteobacteria bacterium]
MFPKHLINIPCHISLITLILLFFNSSTCQCHT